LEGEGYIWVGGRGPSERVTTGKRVLWEKHCQKTQKETRGNRGLWEGAFTDVSSGPHDSREKKGRGRKTKKH